jgi:hypothetical protein
MRLENVTERRVKGEKSWLLIQHQSVALNLQTA